MFSPDVVEPMVLVFKPTDVEPLVVVSWVKLAYKGPLEYVRPKVEALPAFDPVSFSPSCIPRIRMKTDRLGLV